MSMIEGEGTVIVPGWLDEVRAALPNVPGLTLTADEQAALLDLARIAAHASHRTAAPLTTFLAGIALGQTPGEDRAARLRSLAGNLER
jgi:hypothetical protein